MSKIVKKTVAQGMNAGGRWEDLGPNWGRTAKDRYKTLCGFMNGHGWQGAQIIERIVIESPTGWQKMCKPNATDQRPMKPHKED